MARRTARRSVRRIAIVNQLGYPSPHHHDCYQGILDYAEAQGWVCVVDPHLVGIGEAGVAAEYDGIVGRIHPRMAQIARDRGVPVVNHWLNSRAKGLPGVFSDFAAGAQMAAEHLISRGFRDFACLSMAGDAVARLDVAVLTRAAASHGFPKPRLLSFARDFEVNRDKFAHFRQKLPQWLSEMAMPVGIICTNAVLGRHLAQICRELKLRVPHEVSIVVQYDDNMICTQSRPLLSSIGHDFARVGWEAAALLDRLMRGRTSKQDEPIRVAPTRLIVRESSDTFISGDPLVSRTLQFISEHAGENLSVQDVAAAVSVSRRTLERRFEKHVGQSIYGQIARARADHVARLLIDTDRPLSAVAIDCGFETISHFSEFFRRSMGLTPSEFRRRQRAGPPQASA